MSDVRIPFNTWSKLRLQDGKKSATSRSKRYGKPGDTFEVDGDVFAILHVEKVSLGFVAEFMFKAEGCQNPQEFREVWKAIHIKRGFDPHEVVWLHTFYRVVREGKRMKPAKVLVNSLSMPLPTDAGEPDYIPPGGQ